MKKLAIIAIAAIALTLSGCGNTYTSTQMPTTDGKDAMQTAPGTLTDITLQEITYEDLTLGYSITLPATWTDYKATDRELDWGSYGKTSSTDFGIGDDASIFNITVFTKDQWAKVEAEGGPIPTKLRENSTSVFTYNKAQDVSEANLDRMEEVDGILNTFELVKE